MTAEAFVYDAVRTPRGKGKKTGGLHSVKPISLTTGLIDLVHHVSRDIAWGDRIHGDAIGRSLHGEWLHHGHNATFRSRADGVLIAAKIPRIDDDRARGNDAAGAPFHHMR